MNGISGSRPYFGRMADENERVYIKSLVSTHMPDVTARFDKIDVRVIRSRTETALENARALAKLAWAKLKGNAFEFIALQTYAHPSGKNLEDSVLGLDRKSIGMPQGKGRLTHISSKKAGK